MKSSTSADGGTEGGDEDRVVISDESLRRIIYERINETVASGAKQSGKENTSASS